MVAIVSMSLLKRINAISSDTELHDSVDDIASDIDRWENDGGRSISTSSLS